MLSVIIFDKTILQCSAWTIVVLSQHSWLMDGECLLTPTSSSQLAGASYMDIHAMGGGIHFTVNCVRKASFDQLYDSLCERLWAMLKGGTTLVEAKSGYGLDLENEYKMLRVIEKAKREHPISISSTYCGAHAVPK